MERPIDPDDPTRGKIIYTSKKDPNSFSGFFVTSYYTRDTDCSNCSVFRGQDSKWAKTDIYKTGLLQTLQLTEQPAFQSFGVIVYVDRATLNHPTNASIQDLTRKSKHTQEWSAIANHPNLIFAIVEWPEYAVGAVEDTSTIDNAVLRAVRLKAFMDFPDKTVCLRDADTLFENLVKQRSYVKEIAVWEIALLGAFRKIVTAPGSPYKLLVASQPTYHRQWHVNPFTGQKTLGCYAAVTTSFGGIPEWSDGSLWKKCLAYIRRSSQIGFDATGQRVPSDTARPTYIGKDEQLLSYVVLPTLFPKIYFYYFEYIHVEGGPIVETPETPFAKALHAAGYKSYPSPYLTLRKEPFPTESKTKRKDQNEVTETTLIDPRIIPLSLDPAAHRVLQIAFQQMLGLPAAQKGGRRGRGRRRTRRRRQQRRTRRQKGGGKDTSYTHPGSEVTVIYSANLWTPALEAINDILKQRHYSFEIHGIDKPWEGFPSKMKYYRDAAKAHREKNPKALLVLADAFDTLPLQPSEVLVKRYREKPRPMPVVFSTEQNSFANNNKDILNWYTHHNQLGGREKLVADKIATPMDPQQMNWTSSRPLFLNSGLILGPAAELESVLDAMLNSGISDDQLAACKVVLDRLGEIDLDYEEKFFRTKFANPNPDDFEKGADRPCFLHWAGYGMKQTLPDMFKHYEGLP